jgi:hypothetical protein
MNPNEVKAIAAGVGLVIMLIIWIAIFAGIAVGNGYVAARLRKNVALWVVLSLIPGFNLFFAYYVMYYIVCHVLGKLDEISGRLEAISGGPLRG